MQYRQHTCTDHQYMHESRNQITFDSYITSVSKSCFYHIRALRHIRPILGEGTANLIASSLVSSRLDYANVCLFGISFKNTARRLQRVQNTRTGSNSLQALHQYSTIAETLPLASSLISHTVQDSPAYIQITSLNCPSISVFTPIIQPYSNSALFQCS